MPGDPGSPVRLPAGGDFTVPERPSVSILERENLGKYRIHTVQVITDRCIIRCSPGKCFLCER